MAERRTGLLGKISAVGLATLASRFLGFFREALIAWALGAGPVADAFYAAFRFPNLFRRLFAEGAFNSAFVPLFAGELEKGGPKAARAFAEQVLAALAVVLAGVTALAIAFMPGLTQSVIASRFDAESENFALTVDYARVMFPYLAAMSLVAMLSGILNSFRRYFLAALAPVLLNVAMIGVLLLARQRALDGPATGLLLSIAVAVSGVAQLALLFWAVRRAGFSFGLARPRLTPGVRKLLWLALPAAITGGITQINLLIGQNIASAQEGAIAVINYADRIFQLPLGVVVAAIGVVLLPELTRALASGNAPEAEKLQNRSLEFGLLLTVPAAVGMAIMPRELVAIVYERGAFTRETTELAASALRHFAWGLPAAALIAVFRPGFYARQDMVRPMGFAAVNVVTNIALSLALFPRFGVAGIAIATSTAQWLNAVLLGAGLWRRELFRPAAATIRKTAGMLVAAGAMTLCIHALLRLAGEAALDGAVGLRIVAIVAAVGGGAIAYFTVGALTGAFAPGEVRAFLKRRPRSAPTGK
jgi:putative peptidoglycan lipid II flippase